MRFRLFLVFLCAYLHFLSSLQITSISFVISVLFIFLITFSSLRFSHWFTFWRLSSHMPVACNSQTRNQLLYYPEVLLLFPPERNRSKRQEHEYSKDVWSGNPSKGWEFPASATWWPRPQLSWPPGAQEWTVRWPRWWWRFIPGASSGSSGFPHHLPSRGGCPTLAKANINLFASKHN